MKPNLSLNFNLALMMIAGAHATLASLPAQGESPGHAAQPGTLQDFSAEKAQLMVASPSKKAPITIADLELIQNETVSARIIDLHLHIAAADYA
jgi:hypothetical protein